MSSIHISGKRIRTVVLCTLLTLFTLSLLAVAGVYMACHAILTGPSESARDALTMSLLKDDATSWIPGLFLDAQTLSQIQAGKPVLQPQPEPDVPQVVVEFESGPADEWADCPDGIRIETHYGRTYTAHVMLIRDPSTVYLGTHTDHFSIDRLGNRIFAQMKQEGAAAAINAGAFNDDGTANSYIGSLPIGMVVSDGKILWDDGKSYDGFAGLTEDHTLVVADTIDRATVEQLKIRDGCCFGPVLVKDGQINQRVYDMETTFNARTVIGQRADGTIIFLCIDGRQAGSIGATYADAMELIATLGAVNACNLDGGASTVMTYRDTYGRYGKAGEVVMCTSYALIQASPRRMPTFFIVRAAEKEG
jgi:hypothetical protein